MFSNNLASTTNQPINLTLAINYFGNKVGAASYQNTQYYSINSYASTVSYEQIPVLSSRNLIVYGDCSINGNVSVGTYPTNSISANALYSTTDLSWTNRLFVATSDISFTATNLRVAIDVSSTVSATKTSLSTNLAVPANIVVVDGSNGTVYGSYLTLTNKDASAYYNVGKSVSGRFNIVNHNNTGVYLASGGTTFIGTSDARLKTNVAPLPSATDKVMALNPCTYQWKADIESAKDPAEIRSHIGFVAQEVEQVFPDLVHPIDHPAGPDYKGVNTTDMIPLLVRAIQEQTAELDVLDTKVSSLHA